PEVHEEEEEKSFFVFEGSTGGWKHATSGQIEEEQRDKELYPELDHMPVESQITEEDPLKNNTQDTLKERLKITPRRPTRASRQSGALDPEEADDGAVLGDDSGAGRGRKRRSAEGGDVSEDVEDDEAKRGKRAGSSEEVEDAPEGDEVSDCVQGCYKLGKSGIRILVWESRENLGCSQ
ncbi:hypothetical protein FOCC_FOCC003730, partial [Frankliniella occidentalis]